MIVAMNTIMRAMRSFGLGGFALVFALTLSADARAGKTSLVAGGGSGGVGSPATQAKLGKPFAVTFDKAGNLYIGEFEGCRVLKVAAALGQRSLPHGRVLAHIHLLQR